MMTDCDIWPTHKDPHVDITCIIFGAVLSSKKYITDILYLLLFLLLCGLIAVIKIN
jgi:hypothetical protein